MRKIKAGGKWKKRDDKENKNKDLFRQRLIYNPLAKEEKQRSTIHQPKFAEDVTNP